MEVSEALRGLQALRVPQAQQALLARQGRRALLAGLVGLDGPDPRERLRIQVQQAGQVTLEIQDLPDMDRQVLKVKQVFKVHLEPMVNKDPLD